MNRLQRRTAEKAVERWGTGGAFSFKLSDLTYVIDPSNVLYIIQHDLTVKYGIVLNVALDEEALPHLLVVKTTSGSLVFEVYPPQ